MDYNRRRQGRGLYVVVCPDNMTTAGKLMLLTGRSVVLYSSVAYFIRATERLINASSAEPLSMPFCRRARSMSW